MKKIFSLVLVGIMLLYCVNIIMAVTVWKDTSDGTISKVWINTDSSTKHADNDAWQNNSLNINAFSYVIKASDGSLYTDSVDLTKDFFNTIAKNQPDWKAYVTNGQPYTNNTDNNLNYLLAQEWYLVFSTTGGAGMDIRLKQKVLKEINSLTLRNSANDKQVK